MTLSTHVYTMSTGVVHGLYVQYNTDMGGDRVAAVRNTTVKRTAPRSHFLPRCLVRAVYIIKI